MSSDENQIINAITFNPSKDSGYAKPKLNKSGGKSVGIINTKTKQSLYLSTPLILTWGAQMFIDEQNGKKSYTMSLQFPKEEYNNDQCEQFLSNMKEFEQMVKDDVLTNSKEWLNKPKMSAEVIEALFTPILKYPKNPDTGEPDYSRAPTLRVKIDCWDGAFDCEIYDVGSKMLFPNPDKSNVTPLDYITKGSNVAVVLRCGGIWFANGKFGVTWRLVQAVVKPRDNLKGRCLISLSTSEKNVLASQKNDDDDDDAHASDSDEEESEQAPVAAAPSFFEQPQEKKIVKKKVVRKKKAVAEAD